MEDELADRMMSVDKTPTGLVLSAMWAFKSKMFGNQDLKQHQKSILQGFYFLVPLLRSTSEVYSQALLLENCSQHHQIQGQNLKLSKYPGCRKVSGNVF